VPGYIRLLLPGLVLSISLVGSVHAGCPSGDLNGDCRIDFLDVQIFAGHEFMASNDNTIRDPQGHYDDWIEIYNSGVDPVNIGGMFLTDNLSVPTKWRIPGNNPALTTIPAGGYLLIWADEDSTDYGLHANFKLNADGEEIGLFDSDGATLIDSIIFPEQTTDISYGRDPETNGERRFFAISTPGAENDGAYLDQVDTPEFSYKRGFYDAPFYLTLATETKDAVIYYTLDGSEPYEFTGRFPKGIIYTGPISISRNTCLRARASNQAGLEAFSHQDQYLFIERKRNRQVIAGHFSCW